MAYAKKTYTLALSQLSHICFVLSCCQTCIGVFNAEEDKRVVMWRDEGLDETCCYVLLDESDSCCRMSMEGALGNRNVFDDSEEKSRPVNL